MFDFGQIVEKVTGLLGENGGIRDVIGGDVSETLGNTNLDMSLLENLDPSMLENLNIDPSILENLPLDQAQEFLAHTGIDPSALADGQLTDVIARLTGSGAP